MRVFLVASGAKTPPTAPSSLTATAVSSSRIDLAWTNNALLYDGTKIERSTDGVNFTEITDVASGVTTYASTGLSASTQYYYRVRAYKGALNSAYSNTANATTQVALIERIIEIDTRNIETGSSANNQFRLVVGGGSNYNVDWGDGTSQTGVTATTTTKTYATAGIYDIKLTGVVTHVVNGFTSSDKLKYLKIKQWGSGVTSSSYSGAFSGCSNLAVTATDAPNLTNVTSMYRMFRLCANIGSPDLTGWDVSGVINMQEAFDQCVNFNGDVTTWNVSNVTLFALMFSNCTVFNRNISGWNVSKGTSFASMFSSTAFNQPIGVWNVSEATDMTSMFQFSAFNQPIGSWNVAKVTSMTQMFRTTSFNQNIGSWNVGSVSGFGQMFESNSVFNQPIGSWNTSSATSMANMFNGCTAFNQNIGSWNVSNVTSMSTMFQGCTSFNQNLSAWNVGKVTNFSLMFAGNSGMINNSSIASWQIGASLTGTSTINFTSFTNNTSYNQDLTSWNMIRVNIISSMLVRGTSNFNYGLWDIRNVELSASFMSQASPLTLSASNLAGMYIGWAQLPLRPITISFGTAKYGASGASARAILTSARAVSVSGAIDPNANGSYPWNGTRYQNANGFYFTNVSSQWRLNNSANVTQATSTGTFPTQNATQPATATGWTGTESGITVTMTGAGWTITDGGQL
jgi:surface protein